MMTTTLRQAWRIARFRFGMWRQARLFGHWRDERQLRAQRASGACR